MIEDAERSGGAEQPEHPGHPEHPGRSGRSGRSWGRRTTRVGRTGARFPRSTGDEPVDEAAPEIVVDARPGDGLVGRTGARFNSRARRTRREVEQAAARDAVVPLSIVELPTGPIRRPVFEADFDDRVWVRPYVRTQGRTRARADLAIETLVSLPSPRPPLTDHEHLAIGEICADPASVAEVAARLAVPLGVARVLIDDMASVGFLRVHPRSVAPSGAPDSAVMRRVLDGLRKL